jgi:hypothetical protein
MPFGISPAPEYFQQCLEREIENLPGVRTVADGIIIYGEGDTVEAATVDHDRKLKASSCSKVQFHAFSLCVSFRISSQMSLKLSKNFVR